MLNFSYRFFFFSFNSKFLKKYSNLLNFHILHKYNSIAINYLYTNLYQFLLNRFFFISNLVYIMQNNYFLKIKILFLCTLIISTFTIININQRNSFRHIKFLINISFSLITKYLFMLNNYNHCLFNSYLHIKTLKYVQQYVNKFIIWNKGIFSLPSVTRIITLLKSPHVHKKARDQYFFTVHKMGFVFKNLLIFYPKMFYLNFLNNIVIRLKRNLHFYS